MEIFGFSCEDLTFLAESIALIIGIVWLLVIIFRIRKKKKKGIIH